MTELKIVATIVVKPEFNNELIDAFKTLVDATRKEKGNVSYTLNQNTKNIFKYTILEVWKSQEAIDIHNESDHFKAFVTSIEGKIESLTIDIIKELY